MVEPSQKRLVRVLDPPGDGTAGRISRGGGPDLLEGRPDDLDLVQEGGGLVGPVGQTLEGRAGRPDVHRRGQLVQPLEADAP